ncbi:MAG: hypothetical protein WCW93_00955 [Candidatus Paceibacterota bacterium]
MLNYLLSKIKDYGLLDKIYAKKNSGSREKEIGDENYFRTDIRNGDSPTWVCFLPWRVNFKQALQLGLIPKNGRVITYEGPIGVANPDPSVAIVLLKRLVDDLKTLNLNNFNVLSLSIGAYPSFYIANHFNVDKLVAVTPGSKLGACIYKGMASQCIKKRAVSLGFENGEQYDSLLADTNPIENLDNLPENIEIHLATHDFYIPTIYGEELIAELMKKKIKTKVVRHNGKGHVLTMIQFGRDNLY